jgi:hypothetical protein
MTSPVPQEADRLLPGSARAASNWRVVKTQTILDVCGGYLVETGIKN